MRIVEIVRSRLFLGIVLGLAVGAAAQGAALAVMGRSDRFPAAMPVGPPLGALADVAVREAGVRSHVRLADIGGGSCRFIIVYSPVCGASATAALRWHKDILASPDTAALPQGWTVAWLSVADSAASVDFLPKGFGLRRLYAENEAKVIAHLGIRAFPAHLILDAQGKILSGGPGAPLYRMEAYGSDCRVSAPNSDRQ